MAQTLGSKLGLPLSPPFEKGNGGDRPRSPTRSFLVLGVERQRIRGGPYLPREKDVMSRATAATAPAGPVGAIPGVGVAASGPRGPAHAVRLADTRDNRNAAGCTANPGGTGRSSRVGHSHAGELLGFF